MNVEQHIKQAESISPSSSGKPGPEFIDFYQTERSHLAFLLEQLKESDLGTKNFHLRSGMMVPDQGLIDEQIKDFCRLSYRTPEGETAACPGALWDWKGCPPHAPQIQETKKLLLQARAFWVIQFEGSEENTEQKSVHVFMDKLAEELKAADYPVLAVYASGPCRVCPKGCPETGECRQPNRRLFALESMGFWVNSLCRAASQFPLQDQGPREVRWIKDWRLPTQDTSEVGYVTGVLLGERPQKI